MFNNIANQLKNSAKIVYWSGLLASLALAISQIYFIDLDSFFYNLLIMAAIMWVGGIGSAIVACVLYALGELVEKTTANEQNTREILNILKSVPFQRNVQNESVASTSKEYQNEEAVVPPQISLKKACQCECGEMFYGLHCPVCGRKAQSQNTIHTENANVHKWRCSGCGNMRSQSPCEYCGKE